MGPAPRSAEGMGVRRKGSKSVIGSLHSLRWRMGVILVALALRGVARNGVPDSPWAVVVRRDLIGTPEYVWAQVFAGASVAVAACALARDPLSPMRAAAASLAAAGSPMAGLGLALVVAEGGLRALGSEVVTKKAREGPDPSIGAMDGVKRLAGAAHVASLMYVAALAYSRDLVGTWPAVAVPHGGIRGLGEISGVAVTALILAACRAGFRGALGALVATPLLGPGCVLCHVLDE